MNTSLPYINSEGGPIVIGDYALLRHWTGAFGEGTDYEDAVQAVMRHSVAAMTVQGGIALVWDIRGPGTAFVIRKEDETVVIARLWANREPTDTEISELANAARWSNTGAQIQVGCGYALVMWAAENASTFGEPAGETGVPRGTLSVGHGATFFSLVPGTYCASLGSVTEGAIHATLLQLRRRS